MTSSRTGDKVGTTRPQATIGVQGTSSLARSSRAGWPVQVEPGRAPQSAKLPIETRYPTRVSIKTYKKGKTVPSDGLSRELRDLRVALFILFLVDSGQKTGIKRGFRVLRDTSQGSALRTRKPLKRFDRNFISPAGGMAFSLTHTGKPYR